MTSMAMGRLRSAYGSVGSDLSALPTPLRRAYTLNFFAFLGSLGLLLAGFAELRRGLLFASSDYLLVGEPTAVLYLDPRQAPLLLIAAFGAWLSYRRLASFERSFLHQPRLHILTSLLAAAILIILLLDLLLLYRGVAAGRVAEQGSIGIAQAIPTTVFPDWADPIRDGLNYLALVWHATLLALLIGALVMTLSASVSRTWLSGSGFRSHVAGAALAAPQPFCSCCAAPIAAVLYRGGAALGPTLAFVVSSPMLNVTTLLLATLLLPPEFVVLRLAGGVAIGVLATYLASLAVSRFTAKNTPTVTVHGSGRSRRIMDAYTRLFYFGQPESARLPDAPAAFITAWFRSVWRMGMVILPLLFVGSVVTAALVALLPTPENNLLGVLTAGAFGTLLMVPTWAEIPVAHRLIQEGLSAPAATLLLTLPAVSVPSLVIVGGAMTSWRASLLLGFMVFAIGVLAGVAFLAG